MTLSHRQAAPEQLVDGTRRLCPVCGRQVGVRESDGSLRAHRVGRGVYAWPCPGAEPTISKS